MLGLPLFSGWISSGPSDLDSEISPDIRQALMAAGSSLVSWLEEKDLEEIS